MNFNLLLFELINFLLKIIEKVFTWTSKKEGGEPFTSSYSGQFKNNTFEGEGKYTWPDGATYTGGWHEGKFALFFTD